MNIDAEWKKNNSQRKSARRLYIVKPFLYMSYYTRQRKTKDDQGLFLGVLLEVNLCLYFSENDELDTIISKRRTIYNFFWVSIEVLKSIDSYLHLISCQTVSVSSI